VSGPCLTTSQRPTATRRRVCKKLWQAILDELTDDQDVVRTELEAAAQAVGRALWVAAGSPTKQQDRERVPDEDKQAIVAQHKGPCIRPDAVIRAEAEKVAHELTRQKKGWEIAAMNLDPADYAMFVREKATVTRRLEQWETVKKTAPGCNENGTWGTSFGGVVGSATTN
jgi:hypothetical protein